MVKRMYPIAVGLSKKNISNAIRDLYKQGYRDISYASALVDGGDYYNIYYKRKKKLKNKLIKMKGTGHPAKEYWISDKKLKIFPSMKKII